MESEREEALKAGRQPKYSGRCRNLAAEDAARRVNGGEAAAVRLKIEPGEFRWHDLVHGEVVFSSEVIGDPILVRSDGHPAYNYAVVIDDRLMEISHVIRGDDHISNTPRQLALYGALGWEPPAFAHLSTILGPDRSRLSKRHGATSLQNFREEGVLPEALRNYLALLGWSPADGKTEIFEGKVLVEQFSLTHVTKSPAVFDPEKLAWMNRHYMKMAAPARMAAESARFFIARGFLRRRTDDALGYVESLLPMAVGSVDRLEEIPDRLAFLFRFDAAASLARSEVAEVVHETGAREVIAALPEAINGPMLDRDAFRAMASRVKERTGQKGRALFHPIRVALTGEAGGPELDLSVPAIDRGAALPPDAGVAPVASNRERARAFAAAIA